MVAPVAENRRARFDYAVSEEFEAGLVLTGPEVRAMRSGRANIAEAYVSPEGGELWLVNSSIEAVGGAVPGFGAAYEPRRRRKLLLGRREIARISEEVSRGGMTAVPLSLYWNERGIAKIRIAVARGRKAHDKREAVKQREWKREKSRLMSGSR